MTLVFYLIAIRTFFFFFEKWKLSHNIKYKELLYSQTCLCSYNYDIVCKHQFWVLFCFFALTFVITDFAVLNGFFFFMELQISAKVFGLGLQTHCTFLSNNLDLSSHTSIFWLAGVFCHVTCPPIVDQYSFYGSVWHQ